MVSCGLCRYDTDWNPQIDLQAQARAHRIGQTKEVLAFMSRLLNHSTSVGLVKSPDVSLSLIISRKCMVL